MPDDRITVELVYTGAVRLSGGTYGHGWLSLTSERSHYFRKGPAATVGAVYRWTYTDEALSQVAVSGPEAPKFVRQLTRAEEARIPEWEAEHYAVKLAQRNSSQARREQFSDLREGLAPYRLAYHKLIGGDARAAYLAAVLQAVTG